MKQHTLRKIVLSSVMLLTTGYMASASAHNIPGAPTSNTAPVETLTRGLNAFDVYHSQCFTDTNFLQPDTQSNTAAFRMRAQVAGVSGNGLYKVTLAANRTAGPGGQQQASCVDAINNGLMPAAPGLPYCNATGNPNAENSAIVNAGNGAYDIVVSHPLGSDTPAGTTTNSVNGSGYNVLFHCETSAGLHTGTSADGTPTGSDYIQIINY